MDRNRSAATAIDEFLGGLVAAGSIERLSCHRGCQFGTSEALSLSGTFAQ
jgi:hypothetical protein